MVYRFLQHNLLKIRKKFNDVVEKREESIT